MFAITPWQEWIRKPLTRINPSQLTTEVFRANDIRGTVPEQINPLFALRLGMAIARQIKSQQHNQVNQQIFVCRDVRLSSDAIHQALVAGLLAAGVDVIDLGIGPTPLVGFAVSTASKQSNGIMVTASHNPAHYNGFKIIINGQTLNGAQIAALQSELAASSASPASQSLIDECEVRYTHQDLHATYIEKLQQAFPSFQGLNIVIDGANGAASQLAVNALTALNCQIHCLFCEPDGRFPNRAPDTAVPSELQAVSQRVIDQGADIGLAFDGDGDRLAVIGSDGHIISPDHLMMLFAADVLRSHPNTKIVFDIKCSHHLPIWIKQHQGLPVMAPSGRSFALETMQQEQALMAGEFSSHFFFADLWNGFDDGIYAAARIISICQQQSASITELVKQLPDSVASTDIYIECDLNKRDQLLNDIAQSAIFRHATCIRIDGYRFELENGWVLLRKSNTSAAITLRYEANTQDAFDEMSCNLRELFSELLPNVRLCF